jgi:hypothetical protein
MARNYQPQRSMGPVAWRRLQLLGGIVGSRNGVVLLIVPASDFGEDGWLHGRMAILRGVKSGSRVLPVWPI